MYIINQTQKENGDYNVKEKNQSPQEIDRILSFFLHLAPSSTTIYKNNNFSSSLPLLLCNKNKTNAWNYPTSRKTFLSVQIY